MWLSGHAGSAAVVSRGDVPAIHWLVGARRIVARHAVSATTSGGFYFAKPGLDNAARRMHMCSETLCRGGVTGLARLPCELSVPICGVPYCLCVGRGSRGSRLRQQPIFYTSAVEADVF